MAQFMVTATYTDSAFAGMAHNPHNREEAIAKILSALDMSLESLHMTLDGKLFMVVSGTTEAAGSLMIVAGGSGSVDHITWLKQQLTPYERFFGHYMKLIGKLVGPASGLFF